MKDTLYFKQLVNKHQSKEERRRKYRFVRFQGCEASWARRYRDWRWIRIYIRFGLRIEQLSRKDRQLQSISSEHLKAIRQEV